MAHGRVAEAYLAEGQNIHAAGSFLDGMNLTGDVLVRRMLVWLHGGNKKRSTMDIMRKSRQHGSGSRPCKTLLRLHCGLGLESNVSTT